ncbi:adenylate kinase family protein [Candidatus Woesearchaeota archaeon]|nr:adenylate kinase family protein [Candidatus Woesearchaeota archaeon]
MKIIAVSGTPGTGKTFLSKKLAKRLGFYYLSVNNFITKNKLYEGYDKKRKTKIVDVKKLNNKIIGEIKKIKNNKNFKGIIIDSHLSHFLPKKYIDFCIITKCNIKELAKRLKNKKFNKGKIQENIQAEIFGICYNEAMERKHKVIVIDTTKGFNTGRIARQLGG